MSPVAPTQEQFRRETRAITRAGQIKAPGERHEKDDRHRIDDRSRYVLGWSNAAKIAALEAERRAAGDAPGRTGQPHRQRAGRAGNCRSSADVLLKLDEYSDFRELDWQPLAAEIARLTGGEAAPGERPPTCSRQLTGATERAAAGAGGNRETAGGAPGQSAPGPSRNRSDAEDLRLQTRALLEDPAAQRSAARFATLEALRSEALGEHQLSVESCDNRERELREWLQAQHRRRGQAAQDACARRSSRR